MITLVRETPAWIIDHPWTSAGLLMLGLTAFTSLILLNPQGRQVRELFRRRK